MRSITSGRTAEGSAAGHLPCLRGDISLGQRRDAVALGRDAHEGGGGHSMMFRSACVVIAELCHRVACMLVRAKSGGRGVENRSDRRWFGGGDIRRCLGTGDRRPHPGHCRFHRASLRPQRGLSLTCRSRVGCWHPLPVGRDEIDFCTVLKIQGWGPLPVGILLSRQP
jgi:hypothetical protein